MKVTCQRLIGRATLCWAAVGGVSLLFLVLCTGIGVFFRYALNAPINGLRDISQLLLLLCVSGAIPHAAWRGSHVAVDLLTMTGWPAIERRLSLVIGALSAVLLAALLVALGLQGGCGFRCGQFTPDLQIPFWPMYLALGIGFSLYLIQTVAPGASSKPDRKRSR